MDRNTGRTRDHRVHHLCFPVPVSPGVRLFPHRPFRICTSTKCFIFCFFYIRFLPVCSLRFPPETCGTYRGPLFSLGIPAGGYTPRWLPFKVSVEDNTLENLSRFSCNSCLYGIPLPHPPERRILFSHNV